MKKNFMTAIIAVIFVLSFINEANAQQEGTDQCNAVQMDTYNSARAHGVGINESMAIAEDAYHSCMG